MLTTQDEATTVNEIRPEMSTEEQLKELRGVVRSLARIAGPWVVSDVMANFKYFFMEERR